MARLIGMRGGDEYDALSRRAKRFYGWKPGVRKELKRAFNKRLRKAMKPKET